MPTILVEYMWQGLRRLQRLPIGTERRFDAGKVIGGLRAVCPDPWARWGLSIVSREVGVQLILEVAAPSAAGQSRPRSRARWAGSTFGSMVCHDESVRGARSVRKANDKGRIDFVDGPPGAVERVTQRTAHCKVPRGTGFSSGNIFAGRKRCAD